MGIRIYTLAKELGKDNKEIIARLKAMGVEVKSHSSTIADEVADRLRQERPAAPAAKEAAPPKKAAGKPKAAPPPSAAPPKAAPGKPKAAPPAPPPPRIALTAPVTVRRLAEGLGLPPGDIITRLMKFGVMAAINQTLDADTVEIIAHEFGREVSIGRERPEAPAAPPKRLVPRAPVVTFMGHIDHGKTSLLDAIRRTRVAEREAGGITQHIGAYEVALDKGRITFLDTPGHETFTAMRARGANVTDIAVLVVAADDGVMPQTREAIDHARAAKVPIMVAVNKIDKPGASPEKVRGQLLEAGFTPEEYGGQTIFCDVSAVTRQGIDHLLEMIVLQAEVLELRADADAAPEAIVIEARMDRGRGAVATVLVRSGTLRVGNPIVCGPYAGKVKALFDFRGGRVVEAGPSTPVEVLGLDGVPQPGELLTVPAGDREARRIAEERRIDRAAAGGAAVSKMTLEELFSKISAGKAKELLLVIKGDVQGSVEALRDALVKLGTEKVAVSILRCAVGDVNENDVMLAAASDAVIIGFQARIDVAAKELSRRESVEIKLYNVIYEVIEDVRKAMEGLLEPAIRETVIGRAEVRQVFRVGKGDRVAGCLVVDGKVTENARARVIRGEKIIHEGTIASLRRFKDAVREVRGGTECGIRLAGAVDLQEGDSIEAFTMEKVPQRL
ncbi:MAG: translation initiation factor IF-2 [bacterium]|nr:translation initiation factor IF-2 [bacterium]